MKKILLAIVVVVALFFTGSCKKDADGNTIYKMSASIGGKQWTAPLPAGVLSSGVMVVTGTSLLGETVIVTIKGDNTGTYDLSLIPSKAECLGTYKATLTATTEDTYVSTTGKVIVTKLDKTKNLVSGTFEFTTANSSLSIKQITNGAFNDVTFISQ